MAIEVFSNDQKMVIARLNRSGVDMKDIAIVADVSLATAYKAGKDGEFLNHINELENHINELEFSNRKLTVQKQFLELSNRKLTAEIELLKQDKKQAIFFKE